MALPLTDNDFPLMNIGSLVYRRTQSSPLFAAPDEQLAAELVRRLNRDHEIGFAAKIAHSHGEPLVLHVAGGGGP